MYRVVGVVGMVGVVRVVAAIEMVLMASAVVEAGGCVVVRGHGRGAAAACVVHRDCRVV